MNACGRMAMTMAQQFKPPRHHRPYEFSERRETDMPHGMCFAQFAA